MKILKVIHGYPPLFNAGSEVYSQSICNELSRNNKVLVFTREENPFLPDLFTRRITINENLVIEYINNSNGKDRYRCSQIDDAVEKLVHEFKPDIAHIGHLNHLSTGVIDVLHSHRIPIVYTLHDFWLMCPRGQFLTRSVGRTENFRLCDKQENDKCSRNCYEVYHSGRERDGNIDSDHWSEWVSRRMDETKRIVSKVDLFLAPSNYLKNRFIKEFNVPRTKIKYLDYGFSEEYLHPIESTPRQLFTFGYIGTHIPAKGVDLLIKAFQQICIPAKLIIYGREKEPFTSALKTIAKNSFNEIEFRPEYKNEEIAIKVFNEIDAIVVPSIWGENSPLVIHEAQACEIPVITANYGGMKEYVHHKVNGLLFNHRDTQSIHEQLTWAIEHPAKMKEMGRTGYLYSENGRVPSLKEHCAELMTIYRSYLKKFWRLTLDTNPEDCNLKCTMCEEHSPFSTYIKEKLNGKRRRMPEAWLEEIFRQASELEIKEIIPSTMGEPLLYKHFDKIVELCKTSGILMNLTTNGTFPKISGKSVQEWAEQIIPVTSDIKFSWNGATSQTSEKVMLGINFKHALDNVKTFVIERNEIYKKTGHYCRLTFQLTFMEENMHELDDIIKLASKLDIDRVKGHHLWAHFDQIKEHNFKRNKPSIERWNKYAKSAVKTANEHFRPNGKKVLLENVHPLEYDESISVSTDRECPFLGQELWVSATGKFSPCCAPDEERQALGDFGSFPDKSIRDILTGNQYLDLVNNYKKRELCKTCLMRK
jgi:glycosyltransferase involved in cell wall biosynthesis/MoaA/NifB/PqqE/SkfB family radical SAM enzyme